MFRIVTFNANGVRSALTKGFFKWFQAQNADVLCIQELKAQEKDIPAEVAELPRLSGLLPLRRKEGLLGLRHLVPPEARRGPLRIRRSRV